jgi:protein TonB
VTVDQAGAGVALREEPLETVLGLGGREDKLVFAIALAGALAVHSVAGARAMRVFPYLAELAGAVRSGIAERLRSQIDINMDEPPPPPKPEPEPEPEPEPPPTAQHKAPTPEAPPAPAEAAKVLTAESDPNEPVDLTNTIVQGEAEVYRGGITASSGTSKTAVRNTAAVPTGIGAGTPKATVVAAPKVDLSKAPTPIDPNYWKNCPFPSEADPEGINQAKVTLAVIVSPDGRGRTVTVVKDPGFGFGKAARACALRAAYSPGLNAAGQAIEQTTTFTVRFTR